VAPQIKTKSTPPAYKTISVKPPVGPKWLPPVICAGLAAMVWLVFGSSLGFRFLNLDDPVYVTANPRVQTGLGFENIGWAFTHLDIGLWSPITTLSHMLDCQLFGMNPAGHHFTNVLLHTATTIVLFLALWKMTSLLWRSAFVAALFAIHPLRVESVTWIAERKDMLNGLFFALTLAAYVRYARSKPSLLRYSLVAILFAFGLMAKPMLATMPFLLLLLDYWPLGRIRTPAFLTISDAPNFRRESLLRLIVEKLPLLLIAMLSISATVFSGGHAPLPSFSPSPLPDRLGFGVAAALVYIRQMFWPSDAAIIRCVPSHGIGLFPFAFCFLLLILVSIAVFFGGKKLPYLPIGWFWYLGMLVPVSGILVLGLETQADRYTYLPQIGLYIMITWLVADFTRKLRHRTPILATAAASVIVLFSSVSYAMTQHWRDSASLWEYTLAHDSENALAQENMGADLSARGHYSEAIPYYKDALRLKPDYSSAHYDLANALKAGGNLEGAIAEYRKALLIKPDFAMAHNNLGNTLQAQGKLGDAAAELEAGVLLAPGDAITTFNLANVLLMQSKTDAAISRYREAIALNPKLAQAERNLGLALLNTGETNEADTAFHRYLELRSQNPGAYMDVASQLYQHRCYAEAGATYQRAVSLWPRSPQLLNGFAWFLATCPDAKLRNGAAAVELATSVNQSTGGKDSMALSTLAAAYAEAGRFPDAIATAEAALPLAEGARNANVVNSLRTAITLYQKQQPYRQP
jgi:protein O-mannosyl-transferase